MAHEIPVGRWDSPNTALFTPLAVLRPFRVPAGHKITSTNTTANCVKISVLNGYVIIDPIIMAWQ